MKDDPKIMELSDLISVVIISRNESKNIARAIESVLKAVANHPQTEILLVDSASTDKTVEIASHYPIKIVRLRPGWFLSVSAGRHIGMQYSSGELVLHMDGDMELESKWVDRSVSYMKEHPEVGAVGGYWRNIYMKDGQIIGEEDQYRNPQDQILEARYVGGAALYRRTAIQKMGGFQPFFKGEEGVYLSMGIRYCGYKVIMLPYLMSRHYTIPPQSVAGSRRRVRLGLWQGYGQVLRSYWGSGLFWLYLKERGAFVVYLLGILITIVTLLMTFFSGNIIYIGSWVLMVIGVIVFFIIKKRSLNKTMLSLLIQTLIAYSAVRGMLLPLRSPTEYPSDAEVVQESNQLESFIVKGTNK